MKKRKNDDDDDDEHDHDQDDDDATIDLVVNDLIDDEPFPIWKLVTDFPDVFETHVLKSKLNSADLKFFNNTNRAARDAIKRASINLEDKFKIEELSSIHTLELAWDKYRWGEKAKYRNAEKEYDLNEKNFCFRVVGTNKLEFLRWVREQKNCEWDEWTSNWAVIQGNFQMVKYCVDNGCPISTRACEFAADYGCLDSLKYLHENECPWDAWTPKQAAKRGNLDILKYCFEKKCPVNELSCEWAAREGHLECLKFLREIYRAPWDYNTICAAEKNFEYFDCLTYARANRCPEPTAEEREEYK